MTQPGSFLELSLPRKATDPKDKVYALLGMVNRWCSCVNYMFNPVRVCSCEKLLPDYRRTTSQVYQETVLKVVEVQRSLSMLVGTLEQGNLAGLPTWTPDCTASPLIYINV